MDLENNYFIDPSFIEANGQINESNALDYFKNHPAYDSHCLNSQLNDVRPVTLLREGCKGVFYEIKKSTHNVFIIKKSYFTGSTSLLVDLFYIIDNKIFHSTNYKDCIKRKIEKITSNFHIILFSGFEQ